MERTFREIALEIKATWKNVYFGAAPYLNIMLRLNTTNPRRHYCYETVGDIVAYFLANAQTFRGADARRIKAELKEMIK